MPESMQNEATEPYIILIEHKKVYFFVKRAFDIGFSLFALLITSPILLLTALLIKLDSKGPVFYRQVRVGRNNRDFRIFKFRSMVVDADKQGTLVTVSNDSRITRMGRFVRKTRLDEFPQFLNVLCGDMSFVGPRPEVRRYVEHYADAYMATLLIRPGITGSASIAFRDENDMLEKSDDTERTYLEDILPVKMDLNLKYMKEMSCWTDFKILIGTVVCIFKK